MRKFILIKFSYENGKDKCLILPYFIGPEVRPWNSNMKKMLGVRALCHLFRHLLFQHLLFQHLLFRHLLFPGPCHSLLKCCPSSSIEFQKISRQALLRWSQVRSLVMAFSNDFGTGILKPCWWRMQRMGTFEYYFVPSLLIARVLVETDIKMLLIFFQQMSGIGVDNEVMLKYDEVKKATSSLAFAIFAIKNEKQVVLEKSVRNDEVPALLEEAVKEGLKQLPKESDNYALLRSILMKSPPRYAAIKIFFKADTSTDKVALISW